jgi:hypothetical protein
VYVTWLCESAVKQRISSLIFFSQIEVNLTDDRIFPNTYVMNIDFKRWSSSLKCLKIYCVIAQYCHTELFVYSLSNF